MAAKKKTDWIKDIIVLDNANEGLLGELPQSELENYTIGQLKALHKDMANEVAAAAKAGENLPRIKYRDYSFHNPG